MEMKSLTVKMFKNINSIQRLYMFNFYKKKIKIKSYFFKTFYLQNMCAYNNKK